MYKGERQVVGGGIIGQNPKRDRTLKERDDKANDINNMIILTNLLVCIAAFLITATLVVLAVMIGVS